MKILLILALIVVGALHAQTLQPVVGIASQSDAQRHYLLHLAALQSPNVSGVSSPSDQQVAMSTATEFDTWFNNAVQGFNDVQVTIADSAVQQSKLNDFLAERDSQVSYYVGKMTAKLSPMGRSEFARYISGTQPAMQSGLSPENHNKMSAYKERLGSSQGNYQCNFSGFTCNVTYSLSAAVTNDGNLPPNDTFTRANGAIGSNWTVDNGVFTITSDKVSVTNGGTGGTAFAHWHLVSFNADQFSQISITAFPTSGKSEDVTVRCTPTNCYYAGLYNAGSSYTIVLAKVVGGALTNLAFYPITPAINDTLALSVTGTRLSVFYNGDTIEQLEDSSVTAGNPGVAGTVSGGSFDNWTGGNLGTTLTFNPILDGTENMPGNTSATHTPGVSFTKAGVKSSANGAGVCTSCYLLANHNFLEGFFPGDDLAINDGANIACTVAGTFFNTLPDPGYIEDAYTTVQNIDQNRSQGGITYSNGPDGYYEWQEPNPLFVPNMSFSNISTWMSFATPPNAYSYKVQNWCSNTGTPDADYSNFRVVLPTIYLTGGTWGIHAVPAQGNTLDMTTFLWRITTTSQWRTWPYFNPAEVLFGVATNEAWNGPASSTWPQLTQDGGGKHFCTVTNSGAYKVVVPQGTTCVEHNNYFNSNGNLVLNCAH